MLGVIFAYTAAQVRRNLAQRPARTPLRPARISEELDAEGRRLVDALVADVRAGRYRQDGITCPVCATVAARVTVEGVEVDVCPGCLATWYDDGELAALLRQARDVPGDRYRGRRSRYRCPHCDAVLTEYQFTNPGTLLVDECERCGGVLLEGGEIERAAAQRR
ncbi:MAG: zf-TFIIB domain-containing protein [Planctomycetota bacterium]